MRKAFTLIELLVVIAIIAVLAAILFPVYGQAKMAAKKAVAISNQKQISFGILLYAADYDDVYPRNDGCYSGSSLNAALNVNPFNPNGPGCTGPYYYRANHFSWQKWIMPYTKNVDVFMTPLREKDSVQWSRDGEIANQFLLNTGITGQLDVYGRPANFPRQYRNSWIGGVQSQLPDPSRAGLVLEGVLGIGVVPSACVDGNPLGPIVTCYTMAVREWWRYKLMKGSAADCVNGTSGTEPDPNKTSQGGVIVGHADGHAKWMAASAFLANTPTQQEFGVSYTFGNNCAVPAGNMGITQPNIRIDYPLWGFTNQ